MPEDVNGLLSVKLVQTRDYYKTRKNVDKLMLQLEEYRYKVHSIQPPRITSSYEIRYEGKSSNSNSTSKVESFVLKTIELEDKANELYERITKSLKTLSHDELLYFKCTYYSKMIEETICDYLNISRDSLRRIKESCIIKIGMQFDIDVLATRNG